MGEICDAVGIPEMDRQGWDDPAGFFRRCYRSGTAPEQRDGKLWCPLSGRPVYGKGGEYNPMPPISLSRTISAPVREWVTAERLGILRKTFGEELVEFWMNDDSYSYADSGVETLVDLMRRSVRS